MTPTVIWFRRDLRLRDHPALLRALTDGGGSVVPLFVLDPALWRPSGDVRRLYLLRSLRALDASLGGALVVRHGAPADVLPAVVRESGAGSVHASADAGPYGRRRDADVEAALEVPFVRTGTPYAVGPGLLTTQAGTPFRVFTPFFRAWGEFGVPAPAPVPPSDVAWMPLDGEPLPDDPSIDDLTLPPAGEEAALATWSTFLEARLGGYDKQRNRADKPGTSMMSAHLKYGEVHPRTLLASLDASPGSRRMRSELCWRDFYADVLWQRPETAREPLNPAFAAMRMDPPGAAFEAWCQGRTGYPFVDAGMRQLRAEGWVHNRVRMVVASFLVKDLHLDWRLGARWFMRWLRDGDLASNQHGWQWVAGSGTDAAPYFRVFNPVLQGQKFDPDGAYVRRYVPELAHLDGGVAHEPWKALDGLAHGYPERIVDHAAERLESLARLAELNA